MNISVKSSLDKIFKIKIESNNITIKELKSKLYPIIKQQENKEEELCLFYDNKQLENEDLKISFYNKDRLFTCFINKKITISLSPTIQINATLSSTVQQIENIINQIDKSLSFNNNIQEKETTTLFDLGIRNDIILYSNIKKKKRCSFDTCHDKILHIIGHCNYCQLQFCSRHRLPESHTCIQLTSCKQIAHERNSIKLLDERSVANKI